LKNPFSNSPASYQREEQTRRVPEQQNVCQRKMGNSSTFGNAFCEYRPLCRQAEEL
jgi:hypothetical protein